MKNNDKGVFTPAIRILNPSTHDLEVNFMKFYLDAAEWLAKIDLTGKQYKVLFMLLSKLDYDNYIRISQKEIADRLGMHFQHVSSAIRCFIDCGIISEGGRVGRNKTYRLNPEIGYKGRKDASVVSILRAATKHSKSTGRAKLSK